MRYITWTLRISKVFQRRHAGYPKFKSKHDNHKSYTTNFTNGNIAVDFKNGKVKLPKLKGVKAKVHRDFSGQIKSATVSQVPSGKYYVSVLVETEHEEMPHTKQNIGLQEFQEWGKGFVSSRQMKGITKMRRRFKKYERELARLQRQLSHRVKGSRNYYKKKKQIALFYEKITNTRKDYLHKISHEDYQRKPSDSFGKLL